MSQDKQNSLDKLAGWDLTVEAGKGVKLRFLSPGAKTGQYESTPWVTLTAKQIQTLTDELLQESKRI
jgi:hypothetical protein